MSTVEKVELENGVTLGERLEHADAEYGISKEEARTVFSGQVHWIACQCTICFGTSKAHADNFPVYYGQGGAVSIGCVEFNPEQVAQVKKWLGE